METVACPTPGEIAQLLLGELTEAQAQQLNEHVQHCSMCIATLQTLEKISGGSASIPPVPRAAAKTPIEVSRLAPAPDSDQQRLSFLSPATSDGELGRLAHYRVVKILGEGGMGMVLQAEDTQLERAVAIKVIKSEFREDDEVRQRFLREARAMAQVKSDHVVTVHQVGQHNDVCYIAMELLEGGPLDRLLQRESRPNMRDIVRIGKETAQALAAAHERGLIHRDIKPENVWLEAPHGRVKLLDFGLARPQQITSRLTSSGMIIGSPLYMSPEQARGADLDERTDLFSLGCLLYALITGQPPFGRITIMDTLLSLATEAPAPPIQTNPLCPPALDDLVLRLLAKTVDDRPRTAKDVIAELEAIEGKDAGRSTQQAGGTGGADGPKSPSSWLLNSVAASTAAPPTASRQSGLRKAERRQVTVLVCGCESFESEEFLENVSEDERETIISAFQQSCRQSVERLNGTVVNCSSEGLLACFGYPVAQEDAAARACTTARTILQELTDQHLTPWLAVHTGTAICSLEGDMISLAGEARTIAQRLKEVAADGQIVFSEATRSVIRGRFKSASLGTHKFKGLDQPIEVFELLEPSEDGAFDPAISVPVELTPLTGRDLELNLLLQRWEQAQEGMGQIVLLVGEAGLGKSRLVHAMKEHVAAGATNQNGDSPVIEWRCSPHFRSTGLYPATNYFQRLLKLNRDETPTEHFARLLKHLEKYGLASREAVPLFASLLSLPADARFPSLALSPAREREEVFLALKEWLQAYSASRPVLFVIEDLHWLDASTLEFLTQLLSEVRDERILILLTFRPEFRTPWSSLEHQTSLALNRLTKRQVAELMERKTGSQVPDNVVDEVCNRSNGIPLFVEEFTKMVKESGLLVQSAEDNNQVKTFMVRAIPPALQDLIMARLDRMEGDRELAQLASALGRGFSYQLLAAVCGADKDNLDAELSKLVQAEILYQKGRPPNSSYHFKHALLEDALYNAMVKSHRQQCHAKIAEALEKQFAQTTEAQPEFIAHHLTEAGLTERSVGYWLAAGFKAQEQFANVEAINHFTKGLELLNTLPESSYRDSMELAFLSPLGSAYQLTMGYAAPESGPAFARARSLCEKIDDCAQMFEVMWGNWCWHLVRADLELCTNLSAEMQALAERTGDRGINMEAAVATAVTRFYRGDFAGCREECERATAEYEDMEQCAIWSSRLGQNSAVVQRSYLAMALWHLGLPEKASRLNAETVALARKIGHPFSLAHALYFSSRIYHFCRMPNEARTAALEEAAVAKHQKFALWEATATFQLGAVELLEGHPSEAIPKLEQGIKSFRALAASLTVPSLLSVLADAQIKAGNYEPAEKLLDEADILVAKNDDCIFRSELKRLRGVLVQAATQDEAAAEGFFQNAITAARAQGSRGWELRCTLSLARLWQKLGRMNEARAALSTIYGAYTEGLDMPELVEARTLLASLT